LEQARGHNPLQLNSIDDEDNNSIQLNSILYYWFAAQQPEGQLQMQHKREQNNKYNKITTIRLSRNYMTVEKVSKQRQLVTEYINIFGIIIKLN
jgi:hypothetical protein